MTAPMKSSTETKPLTGMETFSNWPLWYRYRLLDGD